MNDNDGCGCFILGISIFFGVLLIVCIFMGFDQMNDCTKRGGEVLASGQCVKKGTLL